jgi:hypothetical protein
MDKSLARQGDDENTHLLPFKRGRGKNLFRVSSCYGLIFGVDTKLQNLGDMGFPSIALL